MDSFHNVVTGDSKPHVIQTEPSKEKAIGFAIVIILGLGGLVVAGVGLGGYLQAGSLSNLSQVNSIIMMSAGGGGGIVFLIVGIVGSVKNCQNYSRQQNDINDDTQDSNTVPSTDAGQLKNTKTNSKPTRSDIIKSVDTQGGLVYGADAYKIWDVGVLDKVPAAPKIDWDAKDPHFNEAYRENYVLLYIPESIRVNDRNENFDLKTFKEISGGALFFSKSVETQFGKVKAPGWVLISKKVIPESRGEDYSTQEKMVEAKKGFHMPHVLEAIVLNLMVHAFTEEKLYGEKTYSRCIQKIDGKYPAFVDGKYPVVVGGFGSACPLSVIRNIYDYDYYGASVALREF